MRNRVRDVSGTLLNSAGRWSASRRHRRAVRRFATSFKPGDALAQVYGEKEAAVMREEMVEEYRRLLPGVPYVGGRRNVFSGLLSGAARALAMYRVVLRHGGTVEDAGELMHRRTRAQVLRVPRPIRHRIQKPLFIRQMRRAAQRSQQRRHPDDWVCETFVGDGESFDFGMDVTECGDLKYLRAQGAEELCPYICDLDHILFESMGAELHRTKTLAWGCDRCDFRITMNGSTSAPWPPRFVEQTCGQGATTRSSSK